METALTIYEQTLGPEHPATAGLLNNLAELSFAQGRYIQAQYLCQNALDICEKRLGSEHPDTITYRQHLTKILSRNGGKTG